MADRLKEHTIDFPQMDTTRRVRVLLPSDYNRSGNKKRYPTVYLQDGQNMFDGESPFGSWSIRAAQEHIEKQDGIYAIYVLIDHGSDKRITEFSPTMPWTKKESKGFEYLQWLSKNVKRFIDDNYRTLPHRDATVIGGSSMGALVSLYAASLYPEIFSKFLIFSPSLWFRPSFVTNPNLYLKLSQAKLYLYAGEKESKSLIPQVTRFYNMVVSHAINDIKIKMNLNRSGTHEEKYWAAEIKVALPWLLESFKK